MTLREQRLIAIFTLVQPVFLPLKIEHQALSIDHFPINSNPSQIALSPFKRYPIISGFAGPKCFSITIGSVVEGFTIVTPSMAALSLTKNSSLVSWP
jgi:hypothetical protein